MNSLRWILDVLELFHPEQPLIEVETMCREQG